MAAAYNPHDGFYYDVFSAEDAHYISLGRPDLVPGVRMCKPPVTEVKPPEKPLSTSVADPDGIRWHAASAEDAYYISIGRRDLAIG